jgi:hypothetical protein
MKKTWWYLDCLYYVLREVRWGYFGTYGRLAIGMVVVAVAVIAVVHL